MIYIEKVVLGSISKQLYWDLYQKGLRGSISKGLHWGPEQRGLYCNLKQRTVLLLLVSGTKTLSLEQKNTFFLNFNSGWKDPV